MVILRTRLLVADNSGAKLVECIKILGGTGKTRSSIGEVIVVAVKDALPNGKVKKGEVCKAVIVRVKQPFIRTDGSTIKFDTNAVVLLNKQFEPLATRIFGIIPRELRSGFMKIVSLANEVY